MLGSARGFRGHCRRTSDGRRSAHAIPPTSLGIDGARHRGGPDFRRPARAQSREPDRGLRSHDRRADVLGPPARYGRREAASFGFGAYLFGWFAFAAAFGPWRIAYQPHNLDQRLSDFLPTHLLVVAISYRLYPPPDPSTMTTPLEARIREYRRHSAMMGIGDCLVALWLGLIGGVIATVMAARRRRALGRTPASGGSGSG